MRTKIIFIIGLLFFSLLGFSQNLAPETNENDLQLPDVTPPSPEAYAFTKYSSGISEFSGKANVSIPLYTYTAGKLQMPISLNYSASGVKVDDYPTWTGMNWLLNTGGLITRVVKNLADEFAQSKLFMTDAEVDYHGSSDCSPGTEVFSQFRVQYPFIDSERDVFQFNFNGYSGSFYLDEINGILTPTSTKLENPIKIEIIGSLNIQKEFLITTPDGVKYYFGGTNAFEESSGNIHETAVPTAYYLTKIVHPVNGTILLEYETISTTNIFKLNKTSSSEFPLEGTLFNGAISIRNSLFVNKVKNQRFIKKIKSLDTNEEVIFNNTSYDNETFKKVLNTIEVVNNINNVANLTKKIEFHYQSKTSNLLVDERFFLDKIEINKGMQGSLPGKKYEEYRFEYNEPFELPKRLNFGQDMAGYFNGKIDNQSLLPNNEFMNYMHYPGWADRFANFTYASKGVLKKVTYPTGGYTEFEYEPNHVVQDIYTGSNAVAYRNARPLSQPNATAISQLYVSIPHQPGEIAIPDGFIEHEFIDIGNDMGFIAPMVKTQKVDFQLNLNVVPVTNGLTINSSTERATFTLKNALTNEIIEEKKLIVNSSHILYRFAVFTKELEIGKKYKIEIQIPSAAANAPAISADVSLVYISGSEQLDGHGLRVKSQKDFSKAGVTSDYKRYYYCPAEYVYNPIDILADSNIINPSFDIIMKGTSIGEEEGPSDNVNILVYSNLTNQNIMSLGSTNGEKVYPYLTTSYGGDNFENGGIQKNYYIRENELIKRKITIPGASAGEVLYPTDGQATAGGMLNSSIAYALRNMASYENDNHFVISGNCIKERILKKKENSLQIIKDVDYIYNNAEVRNINNLVIKDLTHETNPLMCGDVPVTPISTMYIGVYKTFTFNNFLLSSTTNEYFEPVTVVNRTLFDELDFDYDFSNVKKMTTTRTYEYGSLKGLPTKITTSTSDDNIKNVVVNTYANQANTLTGLTSSLAYDKLVEINNVATPIQVSQFENATLLSTQRTLYKQTAANANVVLPETIQTAKGSQTLEDRVVFEEYDAKSNPTLFSYKDGTKTKYLYNANNQVYLKIESFTGTLDPNTNPLSSDPCAFMSQYPNAMVTIFTYDPITNLLFQTMDSNCRKTTYLYDAFHRLKQIKDHEGNVIKEFDNNYRPQ